MKKLVLLSASLCLTAAVAMAAEAPASSSQKPLSGAATVSAPAAKAAGSNAYSVEDLYKNGTELKDKKVVVRGRAVKVTSGIEGKTWTHIQDGTGETAKGTDDLISISASDKVHVGDLVTVSGIMTFNTGSKYKIILKDAAFLK